MAEKSPPPPPPRKKGGAPPPPPKKQAPPPPGPPPGKKKAPPPPKKKPSSEADIKQQIAKAVEAEDFELAAKLKKKLPSPPKKKGKPPAPKGKRTPPPGKKPVPKGKRKPPSKRGPPPKGAPKRPPAKKPKGKPKSAPAKKKKRRRLRIKLGLRESEISDESDRYKDEVGWTSAGTILDDFEDTGPAEPQIITHQCSMCGSVLQIPKPKRDRYKVQCTYPECGHADMIGV
jgi:hypothetical protein